MNENGCTLRMSVECYLGIEGVCGVLRERTPTAYVEGRVVWFWRVSPARERALSDY